MDEITPVNEEERIFTVVVFLVAFMIAAFAMSSLTSSMTELYIISSRDFAQLSELRRYLQTNGISEQLACRIQHNAQHAISEQRNAPTEENVELLSVISEPLRIELHFEMYARALAVHPFFSRYSQQCPHVMRKVCDTAMATAIVSKGDVIFSAGEAPIQPRMYVVRGGALQYMSIDGRVTVLRLDHWCSEAVLWTEWVHRGTLTASSDCRLMILDAMNFQRIVSQFDHPVFDPTLYAVAFVKDLNACKEEVTDLAPFSAAVESMPSGLFDQAEFELTVTKHVKDFLVGAGFRSGSRMNSVRESIKATLQRAPGRQSHRVSTSFNRASKRISFR